MDRFAKLVAALACVFSVGSAHAVYTELSPPPGWNKGGSALWSAPSNSYASQTANQWINNAAKSSAMLNVGGKQIAVNAALKLGPSAPKVIAALIFSNPTLRAGIGIASWLGASKLLYDTATGTWANSGASSDSTVSDGSEYQIYTWYPWRSTPQLACNDVAESSNTAAGLPGLYRGEVHGGTCYMYVGDKRTNDINVPPLRSRQSASCPAGWYITDSGCTQNPPGGGAALTQEEMIRLLNPENQIGWPMPDTVPNELPVGTPLPVELPVINPSTGVDPFGRPQFIPTGDPVKNPNYDASKPMTADNQPFLQPGVRVTPRPTTENPWQVDTQPVNRPQPTPDRLPDSELNPDTDSGQDSNDKPKDEETMSLCEKHPDILACQNLDEPSDTDLQTLEKPISITPDSGWGAENAACPAPKMLNVQGRQIAIPFDLFCTYMQGMRPIIIAMAWLSAAFILIGARENS